MGGVGLQTAHHGHLHDAGGGEREQDPTQCRRVRRQCGGGVEGRHRLRSGVLLDVGDLQVVQHPEPHVPPRRRREVLQHVRCPFVQAGRAVIPGTDHEQRKPGPVGALLGAVEQAPRGELRRQSVCRGDGQTRQRGDLGEGVLAALGERHEDGRDLAGHRTPRLGRVACHAHSPRRRGAGTTRRRVSIKRALDYGNARLAILRDESARRAGFAQAWGPDAAYWGRPSLILGSTTRDTGVGERTSPSGSCRAAPGSTVQRGRRR